MTQSNGNQFDDIRAILREIAQGQALNTLAIEANTRNIAELSTNVAEVTSSVAELRTIVARKGRGATT